MIYNSAKLLAQLQATGLPAVGANSNGIISWDDGHPTEEEALKAADILAAHDPGEYNILCDTPRIAGNSLDTAVVAVHSPGEVAHLLVAGSPVDVDLIDDAGILYVCSDSPGSVIEVAGADGELASCSVLIYVI